MNFLLTKDSSFHKAANKIAVLDNVQVEKIAKFSVFSKTFLNIIKETTW